MAVSEDGNVNGSIYPTPGNTEGLEVHLKCLYTNAHIMKNKHKELEVFVCLQSCDIIGISETRWNVHRWDVGTEGYRLFKRDRQGR